MDKLAVLTIGQSPRVDAIPDIKDALGSEIQIVEFGILDRFSEEEAIEGLYPSYGDRVLVSRLKSGRGIKMAEKKVHELVQETITYIEEDGIDKILLLCTGKFPNYKYKGLLIMPYEIIHGLVKILAKEKKIGIIVPNEEQVESSIKLWKETGIEVVAKSASPYEEELEKLENIANQFKDEDVLFIVLDCMGYSKNMKKIVQERSGKPVILSRTLIVQILKELF